ncbi:hypothetical protein GW756_01845 [bacterium]|nr:hypothetical protein [bacterium]NCQ55098.1 hypothetical protein [Candidatus Parcubacteria bacterium]NCS67142.1 hypothetical protein [Candidatus Peregrinibacteria bacterium]NCS96088.1 hypothetical protein [bacterium]
MLKALFASFVVILGLTAVQVHAIPDDGNAAPYVNNGNNPGNPNAPGYYPTTSSPLAPTTSPRPVARPTTGTAAPATGGGAAAPSAAENAQAAQEAITAAIQAYVIPTSTRNFSLGNLSSDREASLIISSGNEDNNIIFRIIRLIAMLIGTVAILLYIVAGYFMIFSQGDENQLTKGKQIVTFTSLGLVIAFGAYMIVQLVMGLIYFTS